MLLNSLFYVINIHRTCFIYLALDTAPKEVVRRPGAPVTPDGIWNLKTSLPAKQHFRTACHYAQWCYEQISMQVHRKMFPGRLIPHFADITQPSHSPDHPVPDYFLWGYVKSKVYKTRPTKLVTYTCKFGSVFKGSARNCYKILWHPLCHENDTVATYNVSYSNIND